MDREIELWRHTDADEDFLTPEGVAAALEIGARLRGGYHVAVSTGAQRATQTLACFLASLGQQVPAASWSSQVCGRRSRTAGARPMRRGEAARSGPYARPTPSSSRRTRSGSARRSAASSTACPTTEAAVLGLTGEIVAPLAKGAGVRILARDDGYRLELRE